MEILRMYDKEDLKTCQSCGYDKVEMTLSELEVRQSYYVAHARIKCPKCGFVAKYDLRHPNIVELRALIKTWNTRGGVYDGSD